MKSCTKTILLSVPAVLLSVGIALGDVPSWPPAPDQARVRFVDEIKFEDLKPATGFWGKLSRLLGGKSDADKVSLPFDLVVVDSSIFVVCQKTNALVEVIPSKKQFRLHTCEEKPPLYPIAVCDGGDGTVFLTDSEGGSVYRYDGKKLHLFADSGLTRPTGIAALPAEDRVYVVDTGEHSLVIFDYNGILLSKISGEGQESLHYPTFAVADNNGTVLVNDALNYQIKRFDSDGELLFSFGAEGDGPGTFNRSKGIAVDSDSHVYVVDNMFDNVQLFDSDGRILLVIGESGREPGQFWSPAGIDIDKNTIYVADTYNNRIQVLNYLGEEE